MLFRVVHVGVAGGDRRGIDLMIERLNMELRKTICITMAAVMMMLMAPQLTYAATEDGQSVSQNPQQVTGTAPANGDSANSANAGSAQAPSDEAAVLNAASTESTEMVPEDGEATAETEAADPEQSSETSEQSANTTDPSVETEESAETASEEASEEPAEEATEETAEENTEESAETESEEDSTLSEDSESEVEVATEGVITGFVPLETSEYYFEGDPSEEELTTFLPKTMEVYLDGNTEPQHVNVSWTAVENYDETHFYYYSFSPNWDDGIYLSGSLSQVWDVPWITAFRQTSQEEQQEGEEELTLPVSEPEEVDAIYTEEEGAVDPEGEGSSDSDEDLISFNDISSLFVAECHASTINYTAKAYSYLTNTLGLNTAAACGVMTNLYAESGIKPNNLENYYEHNVIKLSDSEYTSRVNKGKKNNGKYTSGAGVTRYFTKDYCGYGICQWTSLGRREKLLNKAVAKDKSIDNINMQLEFLKEELEDDYPSVWATLKKVPNTAEGAYLAAMKFCAAFEIPANTNSTSASRAKSTLSGYWKTYSGESASATGTSFLGICGYSYPKSIKTGKGISVSGHVMSNYKITSVKATIKDSDGDAVYSKSVNPGSTIYSLGKLDSAMKFSKLSAGNYTYVIKCTNSKGDSCSASHKFTAAGDGSTDKAYGASFGKVSESNLMKSGLNKDVESSGASTLEISGHNYPKSITQGSSFSIKGTVSSNYNLSKVTVSVLNKKGSSVQSKSVDPSGKSYSIKKMDSYIKFGKLAAGTYTYQITAKDSKKSATLLKKSFTVKKSGSSSSSTKKLTLSSYNYPKNIKCGYSFSLKGKVKSGHYLKKVTIGVYSTSGKSILKATKKLSGKKTKTFNIKKLDSKIKFSRLARGTYYYKVKATDTKGKKTLLKKKFTVK